MIIDIKERNDDIRSELVRVWEGSVRATHHFLTEDEIMRIKEYVPMAIDGTEQLLAAEQNPQATGFYEHMGFVTVRRSDTDGQGGTYPILYMELRHK